MRRKRPLLNIGIGCLAALTLFAVTGIHDFQHHLAVPGENLPANQNHITAKSDLKNPEAERCIACLLNRLLNQCIFPAFQKIVLTEVFCEESHHSQDILLTSIPGITETRAPPA